jgi:hypothetical protein
LDEEGIGKLKNEKRGRRMITNIINYDILANPKYNDKFMYMMMD